MTLDEFKEDFKRLCEGFSYQPTRGQVDAFYERLKHVWWQDWREAVTDLLCAPRFPADLNKILEAVEKRAEPRRRGAVERDRATAYIPNKAPQGYCECPEELRADLERQGLMSKRDT